jgi:hypothetical protein
MVNSLVVALLVEDELEVKRRQIFLIHIVYYFLALQGPQPLG